MHPRPRFTRVVLLSSLLILSVVAGSVTPLFAQRPLDEDFLRSFIRDWRQSHLSGLLVPGADLNGDGKVDRTDAQMGVERALTGAPIINPNTVVLPRDASVTATVVDDTHVLLTGNVPDLSPGQILVSAKNGGLLRKVLSATPQPGGGTLVETAPAALSEVVREGGFEAAWAPDPGAQIVWQPDVRPQSVRAEDFSAGVDLTGVQLSGALGSGSGVRLLSGRINYDPIVNIGASYEEGKLTEFHTSVGGTLILSARVRFENAGGTIQLSAEKKLCSVTLGTFEASIGTIPVTVVPKLEFSAGYEIGGGTDFRLVEKEFATTISADLGARWTRPSSGHSGGWSPIANHDLRGQVAVKYLDLGGGVWAKLYVEASLMIYVYNVLGAGLGVQLYGKGDLAVDTTDRTYEDVYSAGIEAGLNIELTILDVLSASWSATILGPYEVELGRTSGSWPGEGGPAVYLSVDDPTVTRGASTTLHWTSTDATTVVSSNFGATKVNGSKTVAPSATTTYTITVSGAGGKGSARAAVIVRVVSGGIRSGMNDLGTLGGAWSEAHGINDAGQVVGASETTRDDDHDGFLDSHAFLWNPDTDTMRDLGTLGGSSSDALSINRAGQVVGVSKTADGYDHAFLWDPGTGTMRDLGTLPGGSWSIATAINNAGQVVGRAEVWRDDDHDGHRDTHAFLWDPSARTMLDIGTLGGAYSEAVAINNAGQVLGQGYAADGSWHAFLWFAGTLRDLAPLVPNGSRVYGINNSGRIVGKSTGADGWDHAFQWDPVAGTMRDLGTLPGVRNSYASGINDDGQIAVTCWDGYDNYAALWDPATGTLRDLGTLGGGHSGWLPGMRGSWAVAINNAGQVVGASFTADGRQHAFLWRP
jgi:probable HAF family extracellular repeat protein